MSSKWKKLLTLVVVVVLQTHHLQSFNTIIKQLLLLPLECQQQAPQMP
jgi:hypothetical protein